MAPRNPSARVTVTLSNIATTSDIDLMEERIMSALTDAIGTLTEAVNSAVTRLGNPDELQAALAEERRLRTELEATEAAEDVAQNEALAAAQAEVDRLLAEQTGAATELVGLADRLNNVGTAVGEAPEGTPVEEVEVPDEPVTETPAEPVTEAPAEPVVEPADPPVFEPTPVDEDTATEVVAPVDVPGDGVDANGANEDRRPAL